MQKPKQLKVKPKDHSDLKLTLKRETALANLNKFNSLPKELRPKNGRKRIAKTLEIYVKQYLNTDVSVRHFQKWADAKPGEALPWAWKVVYGDGSGQQAIGKGQVNVLIQILTGQAPAPNVPRGTIDTPPLIDIDTDSPVNTPSIICNSLPDKQD